MLVLMIASQTLSTVDYHLGNSRHGENYIASTRQVGDGQQCVGGSQIPPLRFIWHVSSTSTLTSTKIPIYYSNKEKVQFTLLRCLFFSLWEFMLKRLDF